MRIVLDTNVLVSALLKKESYPGVVLDHIFRGDVVVLLDERILNEYEEVLARPYFERICPQSQKALEYLFVMGERIKSNPLEIIPEEIPDPSDLPFAEVAIASQADALVTGNKRHYEFLDRWQVKILSPAEFVRVCKT